MAPCLHPSDTSVTYGIVGAGLMGIEHIFNLLEIPGTQITCIADNYPDSITNCRALFHKRNPAKAANVRYFDTAVDLFKEDLCDVAIIATPNHTHYEVMMEAYEYGNPEMHLLVEKPLCTTIEDCRTVMRAADKRPGITYVGLEYRYMPPITRVINDTHDGVIGTPRMVAIREHRFPFLRKVRNWNRFSKNSGGTFVEKCCHFFDLFNVILQPFVPISVYASGAQDVNFLDEVYDGEMADVFDNGYVVVNYTGGRRASLDLCMFAEASHSQEEVSIVGQDGKLEAFLPQLEVRTGIRGKETCGNVKIEIVDDKRIKYRGHHHGSSYLEHLNILSIVKSGQGQEKVPTANLDQGFLSVVIGIAAHISIEEQRVVSLGELLTTSELKALHASQAIDKQ